MENIMDIILFKTKNTVSDQQITNLFEKLNHIFAQDFTGFIKRELTKDEEKNLWVEIIYWSSAESAKAAYTLMHPMEEFQQYFSMLQEDSVQMYTLVKKV